MTWGSDVTAYNDAISKLVYYANCRDTGNIPHVELEKAEALAQAAVDAVATQTSATHVLPKLFPVK